MLQTEGLSNEEVTAYVDELEAADVAVELVDEAQDVEVEDSIMNFFSSTLEIFYDFDEGFIRLH